ncbi:TPA: DUF2971 domain-containing protein [Escherichia coli]|nr:DUF2971 domain-containing protein [Escherichia coli]
MELCHYTSLDGLIGILNENSLWATHLGYLNDTTELLQGINCAKKFTDTFITNPHINQNWIDEIKKQISSLENVFNQDIYVTSFCAGGYEDDLEIDVSDILSQWRGYSKQKQGVCLVFDKDDLLDFLSSTQHSKIKSFDGTVYDQRTFEITHRKIEYTSLHLDQNIIKINNTLSHFFKENLSHLDYFLDSNLAKQGIINTTLHTILPFIKDSGFEQEKEYRIVFHTITNRGLVKYRNNEGLLTPYISIGRNDDNKKPIPIKRIVVGPSSYSCTNATTISNMLNDLGFRSKVEISKIPYRS